MNICANSSQRVCGHVWVNHYAYTIMYAQYVLIVCHMAQFVMVWPIFFRGDSLSRSQLKVHVLIFQS